MEHRTPHSTTTPVRATRQSPNDIGDNADADDIGATPGVEIESDLRVSGEVGADIGFDRVVGADEAGLGGGLDQAEEAQLGITDEELEEMARNGGTPKR
jgi:hypothetical protein